MTAICRRTSTKTPATRIAVCRRVSAWFFYTNSLMWRTEVILIDEMPVDEFERLFPAVLALLVGLALSFWSSPAKRAVKSPQPSPQP